MKVTEILLAGGVAFAMMFGVGCGKSDCELLADYYETCDLGDFDAEACEKAADEAEGDEEACDAGRDLLECQVDNKACDADEIEDKCGDEAEAAADC